MDHLQLCMFPDEVPQREYVYVALRGAMVKIGFTSRPPRQRCRELGNATLVAVLLGGRSLEARLHRRFKEYRIGGEWFLPGPRLVAWLASLQGAGLIDQNQST